MSDAEFCAVCAEPLRWVAMGPCGHKETCHCCVARLRMVCKDLRCVICKQESASVFVTRAAGSYTTSLPAAAFAELPERARRKEVAVAEARGAEAAALWPRALGA